MGVEYRILCNASQGGKNKPDEYSHRPSETYSSSAGSTCATGTDLVLGIQDLTKPFQMKMQAQFLNPVASADVFCKKLFFSYG